MITATRDYLDGLTTALTQEHGVTIEEGENWSADIKHRKLIYPASALTQCSPEYAKGLIIHEVGHLLYTEDQKPREAEEKTPMIHLLDNALEDIRIESKLEGKFGEFASAPLASVKETIGRSLVEPEKASMAQAIHEVLSKTIVRACNNYTNQGRYIREATIHFYKKMSPQARDIDKEIGDKLDEIALKATSLPDITAVKRLVDEKLYPLLKPYIDQIPPEEQKEEAGKAQMKAGAGKGGPEQETFMECPSDRELLALLSPYINTLARNLEQILKERKATGYYGLHKSGKLLSGNAYKVLTGEDRIFSRRSTPDTTDYNVIFCLDSSGSMRNKRILNTYIGTFLVDKVCEKLGFTRHYIKFTETIEVLPKLRPYIDNFRDGHDNNDAGALLEAIEHIDPNKENIILMMSDGDICTRVAPAVEAIHKAGAILIGVGVGIMTTELQRAYGKAINVPEVTKLPEKLIALLKTIIHR